MTHPRDEYSRRLALQEEAFQKEHRLHIRFGNAKLAAVALSIVLILLVVSHKPVPAWTLVIPAVAYLILAIAHELTLRARSRAARVAAFYGAGIARMEDRWPGMGQTGESFRAAKHVYAADLDLFGRGSLFELLSTARLPMGEKCLADWLLSPSSRASVLERQQLVTELRPNIDLREQIAVLGSSLQARLEPESLLQWAEAPPLMTSLAWRLAVAFLALCATAGIAYYFATAVAWPVLGVFLIELAVLIFFRRRSKQPIEALGSNAEGLQLFSKLLYRIEQESFSSPRLNSFAGDLKSGPQSASHAVQRLARVVYWIDSRDNLLAKLAELPLLYTIQVAFLADSWRRRWGKQLRRWTEIAGEMEALLSLAGYSYEHPQDPFPELLEERAEAAEPAFLLGEELGHPLIPEARSIRNSVRLDSQTRVLVVSGSNMSGKSTLLRVVGINSVLAFAGAPIRGKSLCLSPLSVGTRIRSTDSLQEGRSSFFTEILQIREVFQSSNGARPLLFLFDELLEGTNSKDRRIGAEGLLRGLLSRGAIGIITTHDLALTDIAQQLDGLARNMHFEDQVSGNEMKFDYHLREGVVTRSNAIALMKIVGLDVG